MQRTIRIKLDDNDGLIKTIETYSKIYDDILAIGIANDTWNRVELHRLTYKNIRDIFPSFPSGLIQTARDVASETLKATKLKHKINTKKYSSMRMDKRNLRVNLIHKIISISSVEGRLKFTFNHNPMIVKYEKWKPIAGTLSYKNSQLFLNLVVEKRTPDKIKYSNGDILGIDRGVNNILVCSNNQFFNSKHLKKVKSKYQHLKKELQKKGTRSAKRKLKKISKREKRFVSDLNHRLSKIIVESDYKIFVLENLKRMTKKKNGKKFNKKLGGWSFKEFETFLSYKCEPLGKQVILVNPRYTSQKCSECGYKHKTNRNGSVFKCKKCGFELHSDLNASRNIANLGKSEIGRLNVNQPNVALQNSYKPMFSNIGS